MVRQSKSLDILCHLDSIFGGLSSSVLALALATASTERYAAQVVALCQEGERYDVPGAAGLTVHTVPFRGFRPVADWQAYRSLRPYVKHADVVHIHGIWQQQCLATGMLCRSLGRPYVVSTHGMLERWALQNKRVKKHLYSVLFEERNLSRAACMRALTKHEALDMRRFGIKGPIAVIPNGVEIRADVTPGPFWTAHGDLRERRTVLFLSRIHYKKGLEVLCRAWERISRCFPEGYLVIAGPNFEGTQEAVMQLVEDLGITRTVKFVGMLRGDMKWSALAAADAFVLPSYSEGFSIATLEAMAMGLPVIVSRACYFPEISSKQCGWIVEPELEELTDALKQFFRTSPAVASRMGANGREVVRNQYSWSTIGEQMVEVYDWLLGDPRPQGVEVT